MKFYSCSESGEIIKASIEDCSYTSLGNYAQFTDIAITPNGTLYGVGDYIYEIDTVSQTYTATNMAFMQSIPTGLVALDDDNLLFDIDDSLYIYTISNSTKTFLGTIGYYGNGDFAFLDSNLFMISGSNYLIKIEINFSFGYIESVQNVGLLNTPGLSYSLFTAYFSCESDEIHLYMTDINGIYQIDELNANSLLICDLGMEQVFTGATSLNSFLTITNINNIPNVFTPNEDGLNDVFHIKEIKNPEYFQIFNRWGRKVYEWSSGEVAWSGVNNDNVKMNEGVYFYCMSYYSCGKILYKTGSITLMQ